MDDLILVNETENIPHTGRQCPNCDVEMRSVNISKNLDFYIEHCSLCNGIFFDNGELDSLLDPNLRDSFNINNEGVDLFTRGAGENPFDDFPRCPECNTVMTKENFDNHHLEVYTCLEHGVWLKPGQLIHKKDKIHDFIAIEESPQEEYVRKKKPHKSLFSLFSDFTSSKK